MLTNPLLESEETIAYRLAVRAQKRKQEREALARFWDIAVHPKMLRRREKRDGGNIDFDIDGHGRRAVATVCNA